MGRLTIYIVDTLSLPIVKFISVLIFLPYVQEASNNLKSSVNSDVSCLKNRKLNPFIYDSSLILYHTLLGVDFCTPIPHDDDTLATYLHPIQPRIHPLPRQLQIHMYLASQEALEDIRHHRTG